MPRKVAFSAVRFVHFGLPVPTAALRGAEGFCVFQGVIALVHSWRRIYILYDRHVELSVVAMKTHLFVFYRSKHHRVCLF